jgi:hypothetical protein
MAQSIAPSSAGIKRHFCQLLTRDAVLDACRTAGHRWRERKFDPVVTIHLFVLQVLHGNAAILHLRATSRAARSTPRPTAAPACACPWHRHFPPCERPPLRLRISPR